MRAWIRCSLMLGLFAFAACGDDDGGSPDGSPDNDATTMDAPVSEDVSTSEDATPTEDATTNTLPLLSIVEGDWELAAGEEGYVCIYKTITETMYISGFEAIAPLGTHHTVLTVVAGERDEIRGCSAGANGPDMIYASGVGTEPLDFPPGVALKVEAGNHLLLNLHLFNTDADNALTGLSGVKARIVPEAMVQEEAEVFLAGQAPFTIPARASDYEVNGSCTAQGDTNVFAIMPHMHQFGTKMKVSHNQEVILNEGNYDFDQQKYSVMEPIITAVQGDRLNVKCTYDNPTDAPIPFGDSSLQEMCFAIIYQYPKVGYTTIPGIGPICVN